MMRTKNQHPGRRILRLEKHLAGSTVTSSNIQSNTDVQWVGVASVETIEV
jgi:hypothetical protein